MTMTLDDARDRVESIRICSLHDPETAVERATAFYRDILAQIADGSEDWEALAEIALQADPTDFSRWYS